MPNLPQNEHIALKCTCSLCDESMGDLHGLKLYTPTNASGETLHECDICSKSFTSRLNLATHFKAAHKAEKPYECHICHRAYTYKRGLFFHGDKISTLLTPDSGVGGVSRNSFPCDFCENMCASKEGLARHKETHHKEKLCRKYETKLIKITKDQKVFNEKIPHKCKPCFKTFSWKSKLTEHEKTHNTRAKQIECKTCLMTFLRNIDLIMHEQQVHMENIAHKCKTCLQSFQLL